MRCFACRGPFHTASGHYFCEDVAYCGPCYRHFIEWMKGYTAPRKGKFNFQEAALTSIKATI